MKRFIGKMGVALMLLATGAAIDAQSCRNDIPATAPDSRFADNGDGTVTDIATGLMWKQCAEGLSGADCTAGAAGTFTWEASLQAADAAEFIYSDWRLPNKNELESLVERRCFDPAINAKFFPNTPSGHFWSSSPFAGYPEWAWEVSFLLLDDSNTVAPNLKGWGNYVRLLRAGK